jgi:hypothetical protein
VELYDPTTDETTSIDPSTIEGTFGNYRVGNDASNSSSSLVSLSSTSDGTMTYDYSTSSTILEAAGVSSNSDRTSTRLRRMRTKRNLQEADADTAITNPTMCLALGSTVLFTVSYDEELDAYHYPVYQKNSILNTNPSFDRSQFEDLATAISMGVYITQFSFIFTQAGIYVFSDAINTSQLTTISIMEENSVC